MKFTHKLMLSMKMAAMVGFAAIGVGNAGAAPVVYSGNGHSYEAVLVTGGITWNDAAAAAATAGGWLATPKNAGENDFVFSLVNDASFFTGTSVNSDRLGPWLGIYSLASNIGQFFYVTGGPLGSFHPWGPSQPDGYGGGAQGVDFYAGALLGSTWGDANQNGTDGFDLPRGYVIERLVAAPPNPNAVPEPGSLALLGLGLAGLATIRKRKQG